MTPPSAPERAKALHVRLGRIFDSAERDVDEQMIAEIEHELVDALAQAVQEVELKIADDLYAISQRGDMVIRCAGYIQDYAAALRRYLGVAI